MLAEHDPCQAISAEEDSLPDNWQLLATPVAAVPINGLLELAVVSTDQKVSGSVCVGCLARA